MEIVPISLGKFIIKTIFTLFFRIFECWRLKEPLGYILGIRDHDFLDRIIDCLNWLRSIRSWRIRKSWYRDSKIYPQGSRSQRPKNGSKLKVIISRFLNKNITYRPLGIRNSLSHIIGSILTAQGILKRLNNFKSLFRDFLIGTNQIDHEVSGNHGLQD